MYNPLKLHDKIVCPTCHRTMLMVIGTDPIEFVNIDYKGRISVDDPVCDRDRTLFWEFARGFHTECGWQTTEENDKLLKD